MTTTGFVITPSFTDEETVPELWDYLPTVTHQVRISAGTGPHFSMMPGQLVLSVVPF